MTKVVAKAKRMRVAHFLQAVHEGQLAPGEATDRGIALAADKASIQQQSAESTAQGHQRKAARVAPRPQLQLQEHVVYLHDIKPSMLPQGALYTVTQDLMHASMVLCKHPSVPRRRAVALAMALLGMWSIGLRTLQSRGWHGVRVKHIAAVHVGGLTSIL